MNELYRRIREIGPDEEKRLLTVLNGSGAGAKALVSGGRLVWSSGREFFPESGFADLPSCGIVCFEGREIFSELLSGEKKLVVCGGGHVSVPVVKIGKMLGFHVTVLEDREVFADRAKACGADRTIPGDYEAGLGQIESDEDSYFVIVTRAHRHDAECLRQILGMPRAYVGMMGSRGRVAMVKEMLAEEGAARAALEEVHTPIGLKIGAETPEEIAVSIMAEIIEVKNRSGRTGSFPEPLLEEILRLEGEKGSGEDSAAAGTPENAGKAGVLATIVRKQGSAPRQPGTRMLVLCKEDSKENGAGSRPEVSTLGTVGGGPAEAMITDAAAGILAGTEAFRILHLDLTARETGEEGMICGGTLDVMLERI